MKILYFSGQLKRIAAIFFLGLLLFNVAGYRLWFNYVEHQAAEKLLATVEREQYNSADLITLTVPLTLPYQTDWSEWEKVRGSISIDGITYQYVQRKVQGGKMMLQCLPNHQQAKIESARDRFFQLANSFHTDQSGKKEAPSNTLKLTKPSLTDFDDHSLCWGIANRLQLPVNRLISVLSYLPQPNLPVPAQPPELRA